jgi:N-acetylneuraminic acid mutarotase
MKRSTFRSAFFSPCILITLLLCAAGGSSIVSGTLLAFFYPEVPTKDAKRTLTLEERVAYQRAIEEVYWRHSIWPKENANPKPSLDAVMSQAQLEKKVKDYLRNSQTLEDYWQRPIIAQQLQAEMDRMATHTKQSEVLQELFEALGNDPFVIAECLARPALAERLLTNWYAYDQRIHGELKQLAETELQTRASVEQMKQLSGKYSETEFVRSDRSNSKSPRRPERGVKLTSHEWDETVQKLAASFGARRHAPAFQSADTPVHSMNTATEAYKDLSLGNVSRLQEDEERYYATAVIEKSNDRLKLATVSWPKEPLDAWLAMAASQVQTAVTVPSGNYILPEIFDGSGCIEDTWTVTAGAPSARGGQTAVWTGTEMIIWGSGWHGDTSGGRYNPSTDIWAATSTTNAPEARSGQTVVWTGSEMIIWGGFADGGLVPPTYFITGGRYNPITDSWIATSTSNTPEGRASHTAIWTGSEMIIWGGAEDTDFGPIYFNTGGRYNPSTNTWAATGTTNAPEARGGHTAVWTGGEMLVWGGANASGNLNTGGIYNPNLNGWAVINTANAPTARAGHTAVWIGTDMIVWGNSGDTSGGRYNRGTNSWTATSTVNAPEARGGHTAVWTGTEMIVWGGFENFNPLNTGGRYNPGTNIWTATTTSNAPTARGFHSAVWTGTQMIVWGGTTHTTGGRYDPNTNSWTPTATAPAPRYLHTAVWTGSEMIVWGGIWYPNTVDTGGRYNPTTDSWAATSIINAPGARYSHTAVWTGSEMIVWGGWLFLNTGGKYNPLSDSWTATTTANAPVARYAYTTVWTGTEMVVWGGDDENFDPLNNGGRYDPGTDSWAATSITNAPDARDSHTAIWTGSEMIVWGGAPYLDPSLNTGGRYNPDTDSWTPTSTVAVPEARSAHTAVWTGSEMIVWGGTTDTTGGGYNPSTDSWAATSITNAPDARFHHTAVWTGTDMIIWGGISGGGVTNTGGRYDPNMDSWAATSITNAPAARQFHTAVWTGNEMIVWGGDNLDFNPFNSGGRYCPQGAPPPTPTPTPTPCTGRCSPTPRPRPTPHSRPALP